ncbi:MAG: polymer-forming cytoskeletal protein [Flavobacteriales bacterium]|jgi:cytoskeletal protein CcmA (bactofilin family)|nr:polymer-forming cytoskeletal protein [Flavobacteriales bacterium]MDG1426129.1 polymer-forming cytoskeletal protein [Flavobacteriales bacterium]MDG1933970.1 polymer-forming cytoskeletal protein [Flavobacteriales bacterium]MDG2086848.1 polymer-forming cytoskeletal protein [Flavobacteriales bacterium]|tara:strand:- start:3614 stop:4027 length:414 start_codon:yes stop_codon:yes gene_type:complete
MFSNNNEPNKKTQMTEAINTIGAGTVVTGDVQSKGDIRVDGSLKGSLNTSGKVVLGKEGVIEGDVLCNSADISGTIKAKITVSQLLSLKATAKLNGDIITNKLSIEPGASFSGSCSMGAVIKDLKDAGKTEQKEKSA